MSNEKVGYKKPPKKGQFKKGKSGNPTGRPKGRSDWKATLDQVLSEEITLKGKNGQKHKMTRLEAMLTQQANKAAAGDTPASKHMSNLYLKINEKELAGTNKESLPWTDIDF